LFGRLAVLRSCAVLAASPSVNGTVAPSVSSSAAAGGGTGEEAGEERMKFRDAILGNIDCDLLILRIHLLSLCLLMAASIAE
jgi:hypothetical protein